MKKGFRSFCVVLAVSGVVLAVSSALASAEETSAIEKVKICPVYGDGFYYIPGSDVCLNPTTNDARQQSGVSTWRWRIPNNPRTWVRNPEDGCQGGELFKVGDFTNANLTLNAYNRYETPPVSLDLQPGQYVASVLYKGGFTGFSFGGGLGFGGNFCIFFSDVRNGGPLYSFPLGCIDTRLQAVNNVPATLAFTPDIPVPPPPFEDFFVNPPRVVGAAGSPWNAASPSQIEGTLSVWLCLKNVNDPIPPPPPPPGPTPSR